MKSQTLQVDNNPAISIDLMIQAIEQKIKLHENAISKNSFEEEIELRESNIKYLQGELSRIKRETFSTLALKK